MNLFFFYSGYTTGLNHFEIVKDDRRLRKVLFTTDIQKGQEKGFKIKLN